MLEDMNRSLKEAQVIHKETYQKLTQDYSELKRKLVDAKEKNSSLVDAKDQADKRIETLSKEIEKLRTQSR